MLGQYGHDMHVYIDMYMYCVYAIAIDRQSWDSRDVELPFNLPWKNQLLNHSFLHKYERLFSQLSTD
jgi:hypothetical protein